MNTGTGVRLNAVRVGSESGIDCFGAPRGVPADRQMDLMVEVPASRSRGQGIASAPVSVKTVNACGPLVLVADTEFTGSRLPARRMTGLVPHLVPMPHRSGAPVHRRFPGR
ncbi:hypothetical protein SCWH03_57840 [Streptomyces pacificus]|uniref:Uncharacterized protein n=1 Tax=Streptomyces pacificus TaxID=2705029 RepID=A0A6A0B350_9ACTN|nr:hypothetical protein SCWH03_57840 [Streptomyces pacificus]